MTDRLSETSMTEKLFLNEEKVTNVSTHFYQKKMSSILFTVIITRSDVAFTASWLTMFNQNLRKSHHEVTDQAIQYLYATKSRALKYEENSEIWSFICASNALFTDNTLNHKSSQSYIMLLFGGSIAWKANKQDTVTMSSTEAELLVLLQIAKEAIFISRLLKALMLRLDEPLIIECDNKQTLRLVTEDSMKLSTKLWHVNIHNHWLRQEHSEQRVLFNWTPTRDMIADGLTKALPCQWHEEFLRQIRLEDILECLQQEERMEALKDQIKDSRGQSSEDKPQEMVFLAHKGVRMRGYDYNSLYRDI